MSYIGVQSQNHVSPQFSREVINGDGSATSFTLIQDVPGFNADNIMVVVNNVIQEPVAAYTIKEDANGNPRVLDFGTGNVLSTTDECYVQHRGVGTLNMTPAAGSVNAAALQDNLRSGNVDSFTATAGQTAFTLTETPLNAQSISVFVNGIYQKPTTNFTVSGTTLTLTAGAVAGDEVDVIHHTIRTTVTHVADGSVTSGKLDTNIQVSGTLGVTGASTLTGNTTVGGTLGVTGNVTASGNLTVNGNTTLGNASTDTVTIPGNLTVSGTTTTIDTTVTTSDAMVVNNAGSDVGLKVNSTSTGHILQLQDNGTDKFVVADGGATTISANVTVDNKLGVDEIRSKDRSTSSSANIILKDNGVVQFPTGPPTMEVTYLVVAGGGGGAKVNSAGGGGAGGMIHNDPLQLHAGGTRLAYWDNGAASSISLRYGSGPDYLHLGVAYRVIVGAGGAAAGVGSQSGSNLGGNGENSVFAKWTAIGGGGGGNYADAPKDGGSGGGGGYTTTSWGYGDPNQGFGGGHCTGNAGNGDAGGGGGGAASFGTYGSTSAAGNGGKALANTITGATVYYAGGGGGGRHSGLGGGGIGGGTSTASEKGGGGDGGANGTSTAGTANTGGGGGGSGSTSAAGGSGVVIIKTPDYITATFTSGVTKDSTITSVSGYKIYRVTATSNTSQTVTFSV